MEKIEVSNLFTEIHKYINTHNQIDNMKKLDRKELYLLIISCLDKQDQLSKKCIKNILFFKNEFNTLKDFCCIWGKKYKQTNDIH